MSSVQDFLQEVRKISNPKEKLDKLEQCEFRDDADIIAAKAWWHARYHFTNKKKTLIADRFVWFLLSLWNQTSTKVLRSKKVLSSYNEAFLTPEFEKATALDERIEEELLSACVIYIGTITPSANMFGIKIGKEITRDEAARRISVIVAGKLIPGIYLSCAELGHADVIVRCLWKGAEEVYPQICDFLKTEVESYGDNDMRNFVLNAVFGNSQG